MSEMSNSNFSKTTSIQQAIASCCGAIITSLFVTPLDVVKTRLQAQSNPFPKGKCFVYSSGLMDHICVCESGDSKGWYKKNGHFKGTLDAFVKIIKIEGIKSLWSGLPPTLIMALPTTVIYFTCYDQLSEALKSRLGKDNDHIPIVAGSLSRFGSVTVVSPLELIRTRMQYRKLSYKQLHMCISSKVARDGWLSLWRGWSFTVLRDVPFSEVTGQDCLRTVFPAVNVSGENPSLSEHLWIIKHQLFSVPREVSGITTLNTLCWPPKKMLQTHFWRQKTLEGFVLVSLFFFVLLSHS